MNSVPQAAEAARSPRVFLVPTAPRQDAAETGTAQTGSDAAAPSPGEAASLRRAKRLRNRPAPVRVIYVAEARPAVEPSATATAPNAPGSQSVPRLLEALAAVERTLAEAAAARALRFD